MNSLTCPSCGFSTCPIFYGFTLVYPNYNNPKDYIIELKYICTKMKDKMLSINLSQYHQIIELNSKFNNNNLEDKEEEKNNNDEYNFINYQELKNEILNLDFKDIINKYKNIILTNENEIQNYINKENSYTSKNKYFLKNYIHLNNQLFFFLKTFLEVINEHKTNNLLASFYYISRLTFFFKDLNNKDLFVNKNNIDEFIKDNDISMLPLIIKIKKNYIKSKGDEVLEGHSLPIVGLSQMRCGLILSGSCGLLKIWKKIDDINDENYNHFKLFKTVSYQHHLIRNFIELENNIVIFCKEKQLIEVLINDKDPFKEIFSYEIAENSLESLVSLNQNKNFAAGSYKKLYIYERNNKLPILTLEYHHFFIMKLISLPKLNLFCSSGSDHKIIIYNSSDFKLLHQFEMVESHIVCLCNYNDREFCASTMGGKIWYFKRNEENNTYECIGPILAHQNVIYGILQIKNGEIVSTSRDNTIKFWDIPKSICICKISLEKNLSYDHICQLNDGRLCFGSNNKSIKIFNNLSFSNER